MTERDEPYVLDADEAADAYADLMVVRLGAPRAESIAAFRRMIEAVRQEEREKAAQTAESHEKHTIHPWVPRAIARRIRGQGNAEG